VTDPPGRDGADFLATSRRELRDLAALLVLPAMWVDHDPAYISAGLLGVLFGLLRLESGYVRFDDPAGGPPLERWRPAGPRAPAALEQALATVPAREQGVVTLLVPTPDGDVHVTSMTPALPGEKGLVLVGSRRADFPTERELYLLRVAVGQAAISIHTARRLAGERAARIAAEDALRLRNVFLATLAQDLRDVATPLALLSDCATQMQALATASDQPNREPLLASMNAGFTEGADGASSSRSATRPEACVPLTEPPARLSRREAEVLGLLAQGLSNKEIAGILWLSERTVERHITSLYRKIGVERRSEATAFALRHSLVEADKG
jgi:DNA-binding CsgD family transcriptional regulator